MYEKETNLQFNHKTSDLFLHEKVEQEELGGLTEPCILYFQTLLQNPLQFIKSEHQFIVINDHSLVFFKIKCS